VPDRVAAALVKSLRRLVLVDHVERDHAISALERPAFNRVHELCADAAAAPRDGDLGDVRVPLAREEVAARDRIGEPLALAVLVLRDQDHVAGDGRVQCLAQHA
jgi:hypothetical protein